MTKRKIIKRSGKAINILDGGGFANVMGKVGGGLSAAGSIVNTGLKQSQIADTSELESVIKEKGSYQVGATNNTDLMREWSANQNLSNVDYQDLMASKGQSAGNILGGMTSGATAGMAAGPWGAAAGAIVGLASGIFGRGAAKRKAKKKANALNSDISIVNDFATRSLETRADNIEEQSNLNALANYSAYGGKLNNRYDEGGTLNKVADIGLSMIPIVGTAMDVKKLYDNPSWENAGWAGLSAASDILGLTAIKGLAKGAKATKIAKKTLQESRTTKELAYEIAKRKAASLEKLGNPKKLEQAKNIRGKAYNDAFTHNSDKMLSNADIVARKNNVKYKSALLGTTGVDLISNTTQNFPELFNTEHFNDMAKNKYGIGGSLISSTPDRGQHGGDFSNGVTIINNGGTHEENPNEGVQIGVDNEGVPNLAEEGEVRFNDYIFSNRLAANKSLLKNVNLPTTFDNHSFANIAEKLNKESSERPNDPISKRGLMSSMARLQIAQEHIREKEDKTDSNKFNFGGYSRDLNEELLFRTPGMKALSDRANTIPVTQQNKQTMPTINKTTEERQGLNLDSSLLRYAPVVGSGINALTDLFGLTNKPNYSNADSIMQAANNVKDVSYNPVGNYLAYNPMDRDYYLNKLNANAGASRRAIENQSGGNRATAQAGILAADYNYGQSLGSLSRQAEEYNLQQRQAVEGFNRGTNMANSEMGLKASIANQQKDSNKVSAAIARAQMREGIDSRSSAARSANLTNLFDSLGDIGREEFAKNMINSNSALYYNIDNKGNSKLKNKKKSKGGNLV